MAHTTVMDVWYALACAFGVVASIATLGVVVVWWMHVNHRLEEKRWKRED